ncbi:response regulator receiver protein [Desulfofarcimen acetoxidans DSM 771]|uniref:Stage 0 sporulation protein A homolog n=1 Tax=Desulfofarcimen acetoxidans (strain ATCC 49208 / DSM 771 / KCTC 5769 / VKM B-1644 / 5575) TaxID=485916 RepID=C8W5L3_DESAS|nr:response regulator transcription factor [Desulfofarcimen acetoxidans]ACV64013.1 response regulator receiver protein [Desulfofarcimen acetoxidans DSM 771]
MIKMRLIVIKNNIVTREGISLILDSIENIEIVGCEGADVLEEAVKLQPDFLIYEIFSINHIEEFEYDILIKLKKLCSWTKIIIVSEQPINQEIQKEFLYICDGYLQHPILPRFLLKALQLICYSGHFFFLGSLKNIVKEIQEDKKDIFLLKS